MNIKPITAKYAVSEQISPDDFSTIFEAGYKTVICNRPDMENPPFLYAEEMAKAAEAAGIAFQNFPLTHQTMTPDNIAKQFEMVDAADGPVLAYCASGTRCCVVWALSQVGKKSADEILQQAENAGYDLRAMRGALG